MFLNSNLLRICIDYVFLFFLLYVCLKIFSLSLFFSLSLCHVLPIIIYTSIAIHFDFQKKSSVNCFTLFYYFPPVWFPAVGFICLRFRFFFCDSFWVEVSPSLESTQDFALCQGYMDTYARGLIVRKIRETLIAYLIPTSTCVHTASYLCRLERSLPFFYL